MTSVLGQQSGFSLKPCNRGRVHNQRLRVAGHVIPFHVSMSGLLWPTHFQSISTVGLLLSASSSDRRLDSMELAPREPQGVEPNLPWQTDQCDTEAGMPP